MDNSKYIEVATILEKTASYVSELETKLNNSEAQVAELEKQAAENAALAEVSDSLEKLAGFGYSEDEVRKLAGLGKDTLEKLASQIEQPVGMGSAAGMSSAGQDPLTAWLMS